MDRKYALITGASRGIGRAAALRLSEEYELFLICRKSLQGLSGLPGTHFCGDVGDIDFISEVISQMPAVDLLVNNAGISYFGLLQDMSLEEWNEIINTNLTSVFLTSRAAIPKMLEKHSGKIINISSVWGELGSSMESAYSASKGGVNALTRALAKELAPSNIQVNAISCGLIDTDMNSHLSRQEIDALIEEIPASRMGRPEEVADLILSLAKAGTYLTGQVIRLDGGWC
ncbi:MAG: SDR family NAD(P)-dependent oxidoreductase [Lachnospiraceae bacterium]|nr:SDR family NAD(P)-dependent oxidoreductase [Lachnospiraceae bacterium]